MYYVSPSKRSPYDKSTSFVTVDAAMTYAEVASRRKRPGTLGVTETYDVWEVNPVTRDRRVRAIATDGIARWQKECPPGHVDSILCYTCEGRGHVDDERGSR